VSRAPVAGPLRLGLIGDNIAQSRAPLLHRLAGAQTGIEVRYDSLVPKDLGQEFDAVFASCAGGGYRGINVTYSYKERACAKVAISDPLVRAIGAVNTVVFEADGPRGFNTDHSGFIAACRAVRGEAAPGEVCMIGTGGVGRAVAFGLVALGAAGIRLVDRDAAKAEALAAALREAAPGLPVRVVASAEEAAEGAAGVINCTPVGMVGHDGTPLPRSAMRGARWAFDAVYTPVDTQFLTDAAAEGLTVVSGYELFFFQGVHAWAHFAGRPLDEARLRADLAAHAPA
jgi:shikimate dehydrogenase